MNLVPSDETRELSGSYLDGTMRVRWLRFHAPYMRYSHRMPHKFFILVIVGDHSYVSQGNRIVAAPTDDGSNL